MKRVFAKMLVVVMVLTLTVVPSVGEDSAHAASKSPYLRITGAIENFNMLAENSAAQEKGKTMNVTVKGVKKGNVKRLDCFLYDLSTPGIATVTKKTVTKKRPLSR